MSLLQRVITVTNYIQNIIQRYSLSFTSRLKSYLGIISVDFDVIDKTTGHIFYIRQILKKNDSIIGQCISCI